jgi:hypothetical protein
MKYLSMRYVHLVLICFFLSCNQDIVYPKGGFNYPETIDSMDSTFYMYPYKDSLITSDSLMTSIYSELFLKGLKEPNLSIRPQAKATFRFVYSDWPTQTVVISLTEDKLTVKQTPRILFYLHPDTDKLTETEEELFTWSNWFFGGKNQNREDPRWASFIDSLLRSHPQLDNIDSYKSLVYKSAVHYRIPFPYSVETVPISKKTFRRLVNAINQSGFWVMPRESDCESIPADAANFFLEANTPSRYKIVGSASCPDDDRKLTLACQEIIKSAGMENKIKLNWDGTTIVTGDSGSYQRKKTISLEDIKY